MITPTMFNRHGSVHLFEHIVHTHTHSISGPIRAQSSREFFEILVEQG
jgi:hypothetical protein